MPDHRVYPRANASTDASVRAKIAINGAPPSISCLVRNLSAGGACLEMVSTAGLPSAFMLVLQHTSRACRVIWRTDTQLGVTFRPNAAGHGAAASVPRS